MNEHIFTQWQATQGQVTQLDHRVQWFILRHKLNGKELLPGNVYRTDQQQDN